MSDPGVGHAGISQGSILCTVNGISSSREIIKTCCVERSLRLDPHSRMLEVMVYSRLQTARRSVKVMYDEDADSLAEMSSSAD
jgi:hypothetical protein